jgi:hypothetical protein
MKPELAFLMDDIEESLQEAYNMGLKEGGQPNKAILDSKRDMLAKFDSYLYKNYRRLEDGEYVLFIEKNDSWNKAYYRETIITNFLLSYDDE